ncbi:MAG: hypothetical protein R2752_05120 [Vicinamibacterales bacterium]
MLRPAARPRRSGWLPPAVAVVACLLVIAPEPGAADAPDRLTDVEFWHLVTELSEAGGAFHSDNFTSNESGFAEAAARLAARPAGGAYLGVGPEQNFSYIVASRPRIAFILDIRRQAVAQHLLFKAIFELSADRAAFLARLFSRPRPDVPPDASTRELWEALERAGADDAVFRENRAAVEAHLLRTHGFALDPADLASIDYVYHAFFALGPHINYAGYQQRLTTGNVDFQKLTLALDGAGVARSFLGTEANYQAIRAMQLANLVVPVRGDFAGPKSLGAIGEYLRAHDLRLRTFYVSNVEQYLFGWSVAREVDENGGWQRFYATLATLPIDPDSVLLRESLSRSAVPCRIAGFLEAVADGRVSSQAEARRCPGGTTAPIGGARDTVAGPLAGPVPGPAGGTAAESAGAHFSRRSPL